LSDDLPAAQAGLNKIVGFLAGVNCHGNQRKQDHAKEKSDNKFPQYVPIYFSHQGYKGKELSRMGL